VREWANLEAAYLGHESHVFVLALIVGQLLHDLEVSPQQKKV
jgi:hypothetical protein